MNKKTISVLIKLMIIILGITGIACCLMMPRILDYILPGFSKRTHTYWLIFLITTAVPCFFSLFPAWKISDNIGNDSAFCNDNAKYMKYIGVFMLFDTVLILLSNIIFYCTGLSFTAFFIAFFLIFAIFFALSSCSFALSSLLKNASDLQEQSDLTI